MRVTRPSQASVYIIGASVPAVNVEEAASQVDNVFLYNMDDISAIANENLQSRLSEVDRCRIACPSVPHALWEQMDLALQTPSFPNRTSQSA